MSGSSESKFAPAGARDSSAGPTPVGDLAGRGPVELGRTPGDYIPGIGMISTTSTHAPGII